jgi:hypothetical protein
VDSYLVDYRSDTNCCKPYSEETCSGESTCPKGKSMSGKKLVAAIGIASVIPLILLPLGHVLSPEQVSSEYGNDIIFLFLGGFILAIAMEKYMS